MLEKITSAHLNKRLLICPQITRIDLTEVLVLEISPSGKNVKLHNIITNTKYWQDVDGWVIVDVLPDKSQERSKLHDEVLDLLGGARVSI